MSRIRTDNRPIVAILTAQFVYSSQSEPSGLRTGDREKVSAFDVKILETIFNSRNFKPGLRFH